MNKYLLCLLSIVSLLLSSCIVSTHRPVMDMGRSGQGTQLPGHVTTLYKHGSDWYIEGVQGNYRLKGRKMVYTFVQPYEGGRYTLTRGKRVRVYYKLTAEEVQLMRKYGQLITNYRQSRVVPYLPQGAVPMAMHGKLVDFHNPGSPSCENKEGPVAIPPRLKANWKAAFAYPMAAIAFVAVDVPGTVLANIGDVIITPFVGIYHRIVY